MNDGLADTYGRYPWMGYGTDWLPLGHVVIDWFFVGAWRDPVRNAWCYARALIACVLIIPLTLITSGMLRTFFEGGRS
ncbi:MAG: hypothetical protein ABIR80_21855, partial [Opitutaceae bacterium]